MSHLELLRCLLDVCAAKIEFSEKSGFSLCQRKFKPAVNCNVIAATMLDHLLQIQFK